MGRREEPRRVVTAPEKRPVTTRMNLDNFRRLSVRQLNSRTDWPTLIISHRESQQLDPLLMMTPAPTPHRLVRGRQSTTRYLGLGNLNYATNSTTKAFPLVWGPRLKQDKAVFCCYSPRTKSRGEGGEGGGVVGQRLTQVPSCFFCHLAETAIHLRQPLLVVVFGWLVSTRLPPIASFDDGRDHQSPQPPGVQARLMHACMHM